MHGELTAGPFEGTMSALLGSKKFLPSLRFVVFDVPVLHRRGPREPDLAGATRPPRAPGLRLPRPVGAQPLVESSVSLVEHLTDGRLEGIVLKDRTSTYRDGTRVGWSKVKDPGWYEREAWRFDRR